MTIILKILLGVLLVIAFVVGILLVAYLFIVAYHEWTWRKKIDDNYDEREKEQAARQGCEPCIRVSLRRLSMVVCDCCTLCDDDAEARKSPLRCPRVQVFIENIKPR